MTQNYTTQKRYPAETIPPKFRVLRDGNRFWYERSLSGEDLRKVEETKLADILRRNTDIGSEISDNVVIIE